MKLLLRCVLVVSLGLAVVACGGEEVQEGAPLRALSPQHPMALEKQLRQSRKPWRFGAEIEAKIKNEGYEPTDADKAKMKALMEAAEAPSKRRLRLRPRQPGGARRLRQPLVRLARQVKPQPLALRQPERL